MNVQVALGQVLLNLSVGNGRDAAIDHVHLFGDNVHSLDMVVLPQQTRDAQSHISRSCNCDSHIQTSDFNDYFLLFFLSPSRSSNDFFSGSSSLW